MIRWIMFRPLLRFCFLLSFNDTLIEIVDKINVKTLAEMRYRGRIKRCFFLKSMQADEVMEKNKVPKLHKKIFGVFGQLFLGNCLQLEFLNLSRSG